MAAASSALVGVLSALAIEIVRSSLITETRQTELWPGSIVMIPTALSLFVLAAPLIAGLTAGLLSRSVVAIAGSILGYLAVEAVASGILGSPSSDIGSAGLAAVMIGAQVAAGHLTGVAVRPRRRPA